MPSVYLYGTATFNAVHGMVVPHDVGGGGGNRGPEGGGTPPAGGDEGVAAAAADHADEAWALTTRLMPAGSGTAPPFRGCDGGGGESFFETTIGGGARPRMGTVGLAAADDDVALPCFPPLPLPRWPDCCCSEAFTGGGGARYAGGVCSTAGAATGTATYGRGGDGSDFASGCGRAATPFVATRCLDPSVGAVTGGGGTEVATSEAGAHTPRVPPATVVAFAATACAGTGGCGCEGRACCVFGDEAA